MSLFATKNNIVLHFIGYNGIYNEKGILRAMARYGQLMTISEAAAYVGLPLKFLRTLLTHGGGPKYIVPSLRTRFFSVGDLDEWMSKWRKSQTNVTE